MGNDNSSVASTSVYYTSGQSNSVSANTNQSKRKKYQNQRSALGKQGSLQGGAYKKRSKHHILKKKYKGKTHKKKTQKII